MKSPINNPQIRSQRRRSHYYDDKKAALITKKREMEIEESKDIMSMSTVH
jgi:hypothetical protein